MLGGANINYASLFNNATQYALKALTLAIFSGTKASAGNSSPKRRSINNTNSINENESTPIWDNSVSGDTTTALAKTLSRKNAHNWLATSSRVISAAVFVSSLSHLWHISFWDIHDKVGAKVFAPTYFIL
jgi:hypothetical protein